MCKAFAHNVGDLLWLSVEGGAALYAHEGVAVAQVDHYVAEGVVLVGILLSVEDGFLYL